MKFTQSAFEKISRMAIEEELYKRERARRIVQISPDGSGFRLFPVDSRVSLNGDIPFMEFGIEVRCSFDTFWALRGITIDYVVDGNTKAGEFRFKHTKETPIEIGDLVGVAS